MGGKLLDKATGGYLKSETEEMLDRIFGDFPVGHGSGEPVQVAVPKIAAPVLAAAPPAPPYAGNPFFSSMKLGPRDFTSDLVLTSVSLKESREMVISGKLAKGGENFRADIDMTETMKKEAQGAPAGLFRTATISKGRGKRNVTLYPDLKKYMEHEAIEKEAKEPKLTKKKVGEEVVDGRKCDKFQVEVTSEGKTIQGYVWEPKDIKDFIIKSEFQSDDFKQTMELKNVKLATPPTSLFEVPRDYAMAASFIDLMSEK
jgi:hypothetical protein